MEVYVVCFDISDNRTRRRIGNELLEYGNRIQESVFEVSVKNSAELETIRKALADLTSEEDNNVRFYRICASCRSASATLGGDRVAYFPAVLLL